MNERMAEHQAHVVRFAFPEKSFWLHCAECCGGGQDTGDHTTWQYSQEMKRLPRRQTWDPGETLCGRVGSWEGVVI